MLDGGGIGTEEVVQDGVRKAGAKLRGGEGTVDFFFSAGEAQRQCRNDYRNPFHFAKIQII